MSSPSNACARAPRLGSPAVAASRTASSAQAKARSRSSWRRSAAASSRTQPALGRIPLLRIQQRDRRLVALRRRHERVGVLGPLARPHQPRGRALVPRPLEVVRHRVRVRRGERDERLRHLPVDPPPPQRGHVLVEHVADQRVGEADRRRPAPMPSRDAPPPPARPRPAASPRPPARPPPTPRAAPPARPPPRSPAARRSRRPGGRAGRRRSAAAAPAPASARATSAYDPPARRSSSRSSSRLRSSSVRNSALPSVRSIRYAARRWTAAFREVVARPHERLGRRGIERAQVEPLGRRLAHEERDERGERMPPVDLLAAIGGDEEERQLVEPARDEAQQVEAGAVRPVEVFEHEHERSLPRSGRRGSRAPARRGPPGSSRRRGGGRAGRWRRRGGLRRAGRSRSRGRRAGSRCGRSSGRRGRVAPASAASRQSASARAVLPMPASPPIRTRLPRPSRAAARRSCRRASSRSRPTRGGGVVGDDDLTSMRDLAGDDARSGRQERPCGSRPQCTPHSAEWFRPLQKAPEDDASYPSFLFRAIPMREETGAIVKWYGINADIEDRATCP